MKAEQQSARWKTTAGRTDVTSVEGRSYCATYSRLFGELAGAGEAEQHKVELMHQQIRADLSSKRATLADYEVNCSHHQG
jgi:hypothetical protein